MTPLTREAFRSALKKGQGRAWRHVHEHGTAGVEEDLLEACLHNLAYDAQVEGSRAEWLLGMVDRSPDPGRFAAAVLAALAVEDESHDSWQLCDFAMLLARRGDEAARQALYQRLEDPPSGAPDASDEVVELDGLDGFLRVTEAVGRRLLADPDEWIDSVLFNRAAEVSGEEAVRTALDAAASGSPAVLAYRDALTVVLKDEEDRKAKRSSESPYPALSEILDRIEAAEGTVPAGYAWFGRQASEADLEAVFARLLAETRRDQRLRCLWVFRRRPVPRFDDRLLAWTESEDAEIQEAACVALSRTHDPRVRELALRLLAQPETVRNGSLALFLKNLEPGDGERIEEVLRTIEDREDVHSIGFSVVDLAEANPAVDLAGCLLWVIEHTPCSNCRSHALEKLVPRGAPEELLRECLHDSYDWTRNLAAKTLGLATAE